MNNMNVYFVYIKNEMQGIRRTNEPDVSSRFHISWTLTIQSVELTADDVFYKKNTFLLQRRASCKYDREWLILRLFVTPRAWPFYISCDIYMLMNSTYEVRLILVYMRTSTFATFLFNSTKKTPFSPHPPSTPRTKRHLMCNDEKVFVAKSGIY